MGERDIMKLYFIEHKSKYCENGVGHMFVLADSKAQALRCVDGEPTVARVAIASDVKTYGRGRSRKEIIDDLKEAQAIINDVADDLRRKYRDR